MNITRVPEESFNNSLQTNIRRSLFPSEPTNSESDSDLGHISPINFDSSFEQEDYNPLHSKQSQNNTKLLSDTIGDYDILGIVANQNTQEIISPTYLSPYNSNSILSETPSKMSPTYKLKTPHDTSNTNTKLPKLSRKSLLDSSEVSNKHKLSPDNSPEQNKHTKLDSKSSRVRTTLFPEVEFALSTKLFYSKKENTMEHFVIKRDTFPKSSVLFSTSRKPRTRKKIGQINAGVSHKIRKPKPKKFNKTALVKATLGAMENHAITDYMMALKQLQSLTKAPKLIENKENENPLLQPPRQIIPAIVPAKLDVIESKKRPLSPEPEPNSNKKFFKFSRTKSIVKMNKFIQLEVDHGKISLIEKNIKENNNNLKNNFDLNDFTIDEPESSNTNINDIISRLEEESDLQENKIVLQAHSSVIASENSILLHQPKCTPDLILSPISQMCDVTSGLALNTPKKVKNLTPILETLSDTVSDEKSEKLFPVFYPGATNQIAKSEKTISTEKKKRKLSESQMLLDAGQKKFGLTQCFECNIVYHKGDASDETMHTNYHSSRHILRFPGWKNERIVADFQHGGRIIHLLPGDSKIWWKKISELMGVINQEIGCYEMDFCLDNCQAFLFIKKKTIAGCLVAIVKSEGHSLISSENNEVDLCSHDVHPIKCGIPRIWVSANNRLQGIATELMTALKKNFIFGYTLSNYDIAFSSPTEAGIKFGAAIAGKRKTLKCLPENFIRIPNVSSTRIKYL